MLKNKVDFDFESFKKWLSDPLGNAAFQIFLYLLFAFGPLYLFALRHYSTIEVSENAEGAKEGVMDWFAMWFENGELAYFCIGIIGLTFFNGVMRFNSSKKTLFFTICAVCAGFASLTFAPDKFAPQNYTDTKLDYVNYIFLISVILWFFSMLGSKGKESFIGMKSKNRADSILEKANS